MNPHQPRHGGQSVFSGIAARPVIVGSIGNFVEFFDWTIYAYMAPIFAKSYFPAHDPVVSLLLAFMVLALGFVVRPLGAFLFGLYSDRRGRRNAMSLSVLGMAFSCLCIGLCPDYDRIGIAAPIALLIARLVQGLCTGGEGGSAVTYLLEFAPPRRRALLASFQQLSTGLATLSALAISAGLGEYLSQGDMFAYGWRLPFILGAVMGLVGLYLRFNAEETPVFRAAKEHGHILKFLAREWRVTILVVAMAMSPSISFLAWQIYFPTYLALATDIPRNHALELNMVGVAAFLVTMIPMAILSDRIGRKPLLIVYAVGAILLTFPTFWLLPRLHGMMAATVVCLLGNILLAIMAPALVSGMCEVFSTRVRATGFGLAYAVALVLTSSTFPALATTLVGRHSYATIAAIVCAVGAVSLVSYIIMPESNRKPLDATLYADEAGSGA